MTQNHASKGWLAAGVAVGGALLALALLLAVAQPVLAALPPRPSAEDPGQGASGGGAIALHARFGPAWPWDEAHWQNVWTVVQWQDERSAWHDVEGWQGTLDDVAIADGAVTGHKTWWVGAEDLGKGPFRWVVYRGEGGAPLATSEPFGLPAFARQVVQVDVSLAW
ncbi:MAG: hypothetical protein JW918_20670 [Anaerolineae bacterium]|nr:hypothetical protein [Anaerolineae bacterium]